MLTIHQIHSRSSAESPSIPIILRIVLNTREAVELDVCEEHALKRREEIESVSSLDLTNMTVAWRLTGRGG